MAAEVPAFSPRWLLSFPSRRKGRGAGKTLGESFPRFGDAGGNPAPARRACPPCSLTPHPAGWSVHGSSRWCSPAGRPGTACCLYALLSAPRFQRDLVPTSNRQSTVHPSLRRTVLAGGRLYAGPLLALCRTVVGARRPWNAGTSKPRYKQRAGPRLRCVLAVLAVLAVLVVIVLVRRGGRPVTGCALWWSRRAGGQNRRRPRSYAAGSHRLWVSGGVREVRKWNPVGRC
jgi:hypothetical protein